MTKKPTFVVVGAGSGIGASVAKSLATYANVIIAARREEPLAAVAQQLVLSHRAVAATDYAQVNDLVAFAVKKHGSTSPSSTATVEHDFRLQSTRESRRTGGCDCAAGK